MTRSLFLYWQRLTQRPADDADRSDAPVLDLAGCFGTPVVAGLRPEAIAARLAEAAQARPSR